METKINQIPHKIDPEVDEINKSIQDYKDNRFAIGIFSGILIMAVLILVIWLFLNLTKWR